MFLNTTGEHTQEKLQGRDIIETLSNIKDKKLTEFSLSYHDSETTTLKFTLMDKDGAVTQIKEDLVNGKYYVIFEDGTVEGRFMELKEGSKYKTRLNGNVVTINMLINENNYDNPQSYVMYKDPWNKTFLRNKKEFEELTYVGIENGIHVFEREFRETNL